MTHCKCNGGALGPGGRALGAGGDAKPGDIGLGIGAYLLVRTNETITRTTESSRSCRAARDCRRSSSTVSSNSTPCEVLSVDDVLVEDIVTRLNSTRAGSAGRELLEPIALHIYVSTNLAILVHASLHVQAQ